MSPSPSPTPEKTDPRGLQKGRLEPRRESKNEKLPTTEKIQRGGGGEKKFKGRSPVPLSGTIIEPHTDNFPFPQIIFLLPFVPCYRSLGKNFRGGRGLKNPARIKVPYRFHGAI